MTQLPASELSVAQTSRPSQIHRLPRPGVHATAILIACCAIWGVGLVMVKIANSGISPFMNAALRSVCAGFIVWSIALARGVPLFSRDGTLWAGIASGVLFGLEFLALYQGLALTNVSRGTIFLHAAPFVAAYGEHLAIPDHRLDRARFAGLSLAFVGLAIAMADGFGQPGGSLAGDLLCLLGGILWGLTTVVVRATNLRSAPAEKTLLYQLVVSAPLCFAASWLLAEPGIHAPSAQVLGAFAYTVLFVVVLGYTTWFWLLRSYAAANLHAFTFLTPLFGVLAGSLVLGEPTTPLLIVALVLVGAGIYLVNKPDSSA